MRIKLIGFLVIGLFLFHLPATPVAAQGVTAHTNFVNTVEWNPSGDKLASGSTDQSAIVWDNSGEIFSIKKSSVGPNGSVLDLTWSDDNTLYTGDTFQMVHGWNISSEALLPISTFDRHNGFVKAIDVDPYSNENRTTLASGGDGSNVRIYDISPGEFDTLVTFNDHDSSSVITSVQYSGDGNYLMTTAEDKFVRIYELNETTRIPNNEFPFTYQSSSDILSSDITYDASGIVISTETGVEVLNFDGDSITKIIGNGLDLACDDQATNPCYNSGVDISPDETKVALAINNEFAVYDFSNDTGIGSTASFTLSTLDLGFEATIMAVDIDWNSDNNQLAMAAGADVIVYDTAANSEVFRIAGEIPEESQIILWIGTIVFLGLIAFFITRRIMNRGKI